MQYRFAVNFGTLSIAVCNPNFYPPEKEEYVLYQHKHGTYMVAYNTMRKCAVKWVICYVQVLIYIDSSLKFEIFLITDFPSCVF